MRLANHSLRRRINQNLEIQFDAEKLTTFSGLEIFNRYFRSVDLGSRIKKAFAGHDLGRDFGIVGYILTFVVLWLTGGRRLKHVGYIQQDPLVQRICGLQKLPSDRSLSRWLKQFKNKDVEPLGDINRSLIRDQLQALNLSRVTLDFDGTVLSCGDKVGWAHRGYNPMNRHAKSYFPLLCHVAQTGHFLRVVNRPGNINDAKGSLAVIKSCVEQIRQWLPKAVIEVRMDAAFFQEDILKYLLNSKIEFAMKVPMWQWLDLKWIMASRQRWHKDGENLQWFRENLPIPAWNITIPVLFLRERISNDLPKKNHQLDFFTPDDGVYEHQVILTNKDLGPKNTLDFYNGRCSMEHSIAELKREFGFDAIPTNHYQGNSAHQQISLIAYNLVRNFQLDLEMTVARKKTVSRTNLMSFESLKTLRFEIIMAAGRLLNISGKQVLRVVDHESRRQQYQDLERQLEKLEAA